MAKRRWSVLFELVDAVSPGGILEGRHVSGRLVFGLLPVLDLFVGFQAQRNEPWTTRGLSSA